MGMTLRAVVGAGAALGVLAGCSTAATVEPGPHASDPLCAEVLRSAPQELGGLEQRSTTSQSTRAWGDPAIIMRCGVEVLGPTEERCITVSSPEGPSVDWVMREPQDGDLDVLTLTTYGRTPAVEVTVPAGWDGGDPDAVLSGLAPAVGVIPQVRECLELDEDLF